MERSLNILLLVAISFVFFIACSQGAKKPDVSEIELALKIQRFDQEFARLDSNLVLSQNRLWQKKYGDFYSDFMLHMLHVGNPADTLYMKDILPKIIKEQDFKALAKAVNLAFPDLTKQEEELTLAFKYIKYYFPEYKTPNIISFFSGFSVQVPVGNDYIGIGLDMFLGAHSTFYPALIQSIPLYVSRRFTPENITPRVIESVLREELIPEKELNSNTLEQMIYHGKILYAMDCVLDVADSLKIGYSKEQMEWANHYEMEVWSWFLEENLLYSTDYQRIQKYFTEAPFTPELGENNSSAPKLGSFIGWQIVKKYMDKHPEMTLNDLLKEENAQKILEDSKYKGRSSS